MAIPASPCPPGLLLCLLPLLPSLCDAASQPSPPAPSLPQGIGFVCDRIGRKWGSVLNAALMFVCELVA